MATIALIWELGSDYGHIGRFLPIAQALRSRGHRPVMILRDISRADEMLTPHAIEYLQAPLWLLPVKGLPPPANFTESLFLFGFLSPAGLLSVARAWRQLLALLKPDLLVFDHAPTALLATRGMGLPRLVTGNSFSVPPATRPLPAYRWWEPAPDRARLIGAEARLVASANQVLAALGAPALGQVSDLYQAEATLITGIPEMDVYGPRAQECHVGPINTLAHGVAPNWPGIAKTRVFAYLKPHYPLFERTVQALADSGASVALFAPGLPGKEASRLSTPNLAFSERPLHLGEVRARCDLAVCHSGGTMDVMLGAGKPLLMLPIQMEQSMTSRRVEDLGCGLTYTPDQAPRRIGALVTELLGSPRYGEKAREYAQRNAAFTQEAALTRFISRCEALLAPG